MKVYLLIIEERKVGMLKVYHAGFLKHGFADLMTVLMTKGPTSAECRFPPLANTFRIGCATSTVAAVVFPGSTNSQLSSSRRIQDILAPLVRANQQKLRLHRFGSKLALPVRRDTFWQRSDAE